jgi:Flp pilus assembly protein TadD
MDEASHSALQCIRQASAFRQQGRATEAEQYARQAIALQPSSPEHWASLAAILCDQGRWSDAAEAFQRASLLNPADANLLSNVAVALLQSGRAAEAEPFAKQALALDSSRAEIWANLGACLMPQQKFADAAQVFREAISRSDRHADFHLNLGLALTAQGLHDEAIAGFRQAIKLRPNHVESHYALGNALLEKAAPQEALASFRKAVHFDSKSPEAHNNLAAAMEALGQYDEAASAYRRAIDLRPEYGEARWNLSVLRLLQGDFTTGWTDYDWQWKKTATRRFEQPLWSGQNIAGRTLLLRAEQAIGDTLHFLRYLPSVKELVGQIVLEVPRPLLPLLANNLVELQIIARGEAFPAFDFQTPLANLPRIFKTTLESIPANVPYLAPDLSLVEHWRQQLAHLTGLKIGMNWQGTDSQRQARQRNIPLSFFASLAAIPGISLVSLQKGQAVEQLYSIGAARLGDSAHLPPSSQIFDLGDFDSANGPFMDTAAIMKNLDLVITSDTSVAHLAGALAVPVWVALPFVPDWRWLLNRSDSPWYPTMRLFRQPAPGDWASVFSEIRTALHELPLPTPGS